MMDMQNDKMIGMGDDGDEGNKVDPQLAGYMGPESGPFQCANCQHFDGQSSCNVVDGPIDPNGCCNLFTPGQQQQAGPQPKLGSNDLFQLAKNDVIKAGAQR